MKCNSTFAKFALGFSAAAFAVGAFGAAAASAEGQGNFKFKKFNRDRQIVVSNNGGNANAADELFIRKKNRGKSPPQIISEPSKSDVVEKKNFPTLVAPKSDVADVGGGGKPPVFLKSKRSKSDVADNNPPTRVFSSRPKSDVAENNPPARVTKLKPSGFQVVDVTPKRKISIVQKEPPRKSSSQRNTT